MAQSAQLSVKSAFICLQTLSCRSPPISLDLSSILRSLWKSNAPSNTQVFSWSLFLNLRQTNDELMKRGIIFGSHNTIYPLCLDENESHLHLFLRCPKIVLVWLKVLGWIGLGSLPSSTDILDHAMNFNRKMKGNINKDFVLLFRLAIDSIIWLSRNDILFNRSYISWFSF